MLQICHQYRPQVIIHAAAVKHVPYAEAHPNEAILTNLIGTRNLIEAAEICEVEQVIFISTDKAVYPLSIMGMTKRAAELYCGSVERVSVVRLANVTGTSGSVIPLFQKQIVQGGPVTVTHPEIERYFMSMDEAVNLILSAKKPGLYYPVIEKQDKIIHIAVQMIKDSGKNVDVKITGLRPGEKLKEELFYPDEKDRIKRRDRLEMDTAIDLIGRYAAIGSDRALRYLKELIA
jgi:FlaA1/EpsC-like NDP-sugar epimerase